jgi:two-component system, chemotaxis family, chemotaxis protein CheY
MPPDSAILVVDDEPSLLQTVVEILQDEGYDVLVAANGAEALDVLAQRAPALILLDMRMPLMDGWQFAAALRAAGRAIPIAHRWAREIGAVGAVPKPFTVDELLGMVARHMP